MAPDLLILALGGLERTRAWERFAPHHYLAAALNPAAVAWLVTWDDEPVAFTSALAMPSGTLRNAWREHRTVVLPDFQGLGLGATLGDWLGDLMTGQGRRFYSRTSHPRLVRYRRASPHWRETNHSGRGGQRQAGSRDATWNADENRPAYSFEYVR
jgi:GNAT superfamily N-acetyltransferase